MVRLKFLSPLKTEQGLLRQTNMDKSILNDMRRVAATGINRPLSAYWNARLEELKISLMHCPEGTFKELQGRALEAENFLKILESVKE